MTSCTPARPPLLEAEQEPPEHLVLAVADVQAEDLPATARGGAGRDERGRGGHPLRRVQAVIGSQRQDPRLLDGWHDRADPLWSKTDDSNRRH